MDDNRVAATALLDLAGGREGPESPSVAATMAVAHALLSVGEKLTTLIDLANELAHDVHYLTTVADAAVMAPAPAAPADVAKAEMAMYDDYDAAAPAAPADVAKGRKGR